ncbi:methyltransferase domain-containing protein [Candidatus Woesearchaeota archaeon]|nr:methyltransferase domain-containing protein [Candidatus Woesearchaeota archaeon]
MEWDIIRVKKFQLLKQRYEEFYNSFYERGSLPVGDTEKGIWGAAVTDHIFEFFKKIKLQNYKTFIDLGSGDGKVVLIASLFGVKAVGIEFDSDLIETSVKIRNELGLSADFIQGDFLKQDLSSYDIIFINPDKSFELKLENKLLKEMKPSARLFVYNNIFLPNLFKRGKTYWFEQVPIISYSKE